MRRKDRQVTDPIEIEGILKDCKVCRVGVRDEEGMYIVPLNYGYDFVDEHLILYFHSAKEGRKLRAIEANPDVCFEMDCDHELIGGATACEYGYRFRSLLGTGTATMVTQEDTIRHALGQLMIHQTGESFTFTDAMLRSVAVFQVDVTEYTGKWHK